MDIQTTKVKGKIKFITIQNDLGLKVAFCSLGASIYSLYINNKNMVLTPKDFDIFCNNKKYYGMTIGRVAGRIKNAQLTINSKTYQLEQNEGKNCLHGGSKGVSSKNWKSKIIINEEYVQINYYITIHKDGSGFNGKAKYLVIYKIPKNKNSINIYYFATCNKDTYFALTNHTYFNLEHDKNILNHKLKITADKISTFDEEDFTINGYIPVENTIFDFNEEKEIKSIINDKKLHNMKWLNGLDHRFHLSEPIISEPNIILSNKDTVLKIYTDFDSVHVYTNGFSNNDLFTDGDKDEIYKGITLECSNLEPVFVHRKKIYQYKVRYEFE